MKYIYLTLSVLIFTTGMNAQVIKGSYDPDKKIFFSRNIDEKDVNIIIEYYAKRFNNGVSVVERGKKDVRYPGSNYRTYGVIDTTGKIIIPCEYDEIRTLFDGYGNLPDNRIFIYNTDDSTGIIHINGTILWKMPIKNGKENNGFRYSGRNKNEVNFGYLLICFQQKTGLFSSQQEKVILSPQFEEIVVYADYAVCKKDGKVIVCDARTGKMSEPLDSVIVLNKGTAFLIRHADGRRYVCKDIFDSWNTPEPNINGDEILEYYHDHFIVRSGSRTGVVHESGKVVIPFEYSDIYFLDTTYFWVKQRDLWAVCDYKNKYKTGFDFIDIDQLNNVVFHNFLYFTQADTSEKRLLYAEQHINDSFFLNGGREGGIRMSVAASRMKKQMNRRIIPIYINNYAKKSDGFHLIFIENDSIKTDDPAWDNIYTLHPEMCDDRGIGVQLGNKFGYYIPGSFKKKHIKYQGLHFVDWYSCRLYHSDRDVDKNPYAVVKMGHVFVSKDKKDYYHSKRWRLYGKFRPLY